MLRTSSAQKHKTIKIIDSYKHKNQLAKQKHEKYVKIEFGNGTYQGSMWKKLNNHVMAGTGVYYWLDGSLYIGEWSNNYPHGYGIFFFPHGGYLKGQFEYGRAKNGPIVLTYPNKDEFKGEIKDGLFHGECLRYFAQKSRWVIVEYQYGQIYSLVAEGTGQVKGNKQLKKFDSFINDYQFLEERNVHKQVESQPYICIKQLKDGSTYYGTIQFKKPNGIGIIVSNQENQTFRGTFIEGILNGRGRENLENGDVYDGEFINGKYHNLGVYYSNQDKNWFYGTFLGSRIINTLQNGSGEYPPILQDFSPYDPVRNKEKFIQVNLETIIIKDKCVQNSLMEFVEEEALYLLMTLHLKSIPYKMKIDDLASKFNASSHHKKSKLADILCKKSGVNELEVFFSDDDINIIKIYHMVKVVPKNSDLCQTFSNMSQIVMNNSMNNSQYVQNGKLKRSNSRNNNRNSEFGYNSPSQAFLRCLSLDGNSRLNQSINSPNNMSLSFSPNSPTTLFFTKNGLVTPVQAKNNSDQDQKSLLTQESATGHKKSNYKNSQFAKNSNKFNSSFSSADILHNSDEKHVYPFSPQQQDIEFNIIENNNNNYGNITTSQTRSTITSKQQEFQKLQEQQMKYVSENKGLASPKQISTYVTTEELSPTRKNHMGLPSKNIDLTLQSHRNNRSSSSSSSKRNEKKHFSVCCGTPKVTEKQLHNVQKNIEVYKISIMNQAQKKQDIIKAKHSKDPSLWSSQQQQQGNQTKVKDINSVMKSATPLKNVCKIDLNSAIKEISNQKKSQTEVNTPLISHHEKNKNVKEQLDSLGRGKNGLSLSGVQYSQKMQKHYEQTIKSSENKNQVSDFFEYPNTKDLPLEKPKQHINVGIHNLSNSFVENNKQMENSLENVNSTHRNNDVQKNYSFVSKKSIIISQAQKKSEKISRENSLEKQNQNINGQKSNFNYSLKQQAPQQVIENKVLPRSLANSMLQSQEIIAPQEDQKENQIDGKDNSNNIKDKNKFVQTTYNITNNNPTIGIPSSTNNLRKIMKKSSLLTY